MKPAPKKKAPADGLRGAAPVPAGRFRMPAKKC
jgi:hypothetical protein